MLEPCYYCKITMIHILVCTLRQRVTAKLNTKILCTEIGASEVNYDEESILTTGRLSM